MNDFMVLDGDDDEDDGECYLDEDCPLISKGQLCIHGVCAFECLGNSDCPQGGECDLHSNLCKWSDELTPTTTKTSSSTTTVKEVESPSSSSSPTTTTTSLNNVENLIMQQQQQQQFNSTTDADSNSTSNSVSIGNTNDANPLTTPIVLGVIIILFTIGILFLLIYLLKKRKVKNKSKLPKIKRSKLSTSSVAPEMRSTSKNNNNGKHKSIIHTATTKKTETQQSTLFHYEGEEEDDDEEGGKEEFEETFAEGAVGYSASENLGDKSFSHIQSQTVYGNSASATSMIELQTASHLPVLQEHHFMSQDGYISPQP